MGCIIVHDFPKSPGISPAQRNLTLRRRAVVRNSLNHMAVSPAEPESADAGNQPPGLRPQGSPSVCM